MRTARMIWWLQPTGVDEDHQGAEMTTGVG